MFSSVSRTLKFKKFGQIILSSNSTKYSTHCSKSCRKKIRGYSPLCSIDNLVTVHKINENSNKFYHRSAITQSSFQVTPTNIVETELDTVQFEKISDETLDSLADYFDELVERAEHLPDADVSYGNGVLTIKFGEKEGTYVINRQTPNKQIWLSSPKSGPKRYDFVNGTWIYKHDGKALHQLLDNEISLVVKENTSFVEMCAYSQQNINK